MSNWREVRFDSFVLLKRGYDLPLSQAEEGVFPVIASTDLRGTHTEYKVKGPVITLGRSGSIGHVQLINENAWPLNTTLYVKDNKKNNIHFIYYFLKTIDFERFNSGAGVPTLNRNHLNSLKIQIPDLETQEKIADVLSAYDELIENNNKRIEILEKIAEEIYKEWFIRMRFPGHENVKFEKGIPEGWEVKMVGDVAKLVHGYTESTYEEPIGPKYLRGTDINKKSYINWEEVPYCKIEDRKVDKYKLYKNDIVIIRMADPGKVAIVERNVDAIFASYLIKIDYDKDNVKPYYIFYTLYSDGYQDHIKSFSNGTTRSSINSKMILSSKILIPSTHIQEKFNSNISTIRNMLNKLLDKNQNLIKQRDLLLPRLMNGTIEVK